MPEPGRWRGRITKRENAILIAVIVVAVPLLTLALVHTESATTRVVIVTAYIAVVAAIAGFGRWRFERMNRE